MKQFLKNDLGLKTTSRNKARIERKLIKTQQSTSGTDSFHAPIGNTDTDTHDTHNTHINIPNFQNLNSKENFNKKAYGITLTMRMVQHYKICNMEDLTGKNGSQVIQV